VGQDCRRRDNAYSASGPASAAYEVDAEGRLVSPPQDIVSRGHDRNGELVAPDMAAACSRRGTGRFSRRKGRKDFTARYIRIRWIWFCVGRKAREADIKPCRKESRTPDPAVALTLDHTDSGCHTERTHPTRSKCTSSRGGTRESSAAPPHSERCVAPFNSHRRQAAGTISALISVRIPPQ